MTTTVRLNDICQGGGDTTRGRIKTMSIEAAVNAKVHMTQDRQMGKQDPVDDHKYLGFKAWLLLWFIIPVI